MREHTPQCRFRETILSRFLSSVENTIRKYGLLQSDDRILVALSGGPDSISLLHALHRLYGGQKALTAVHVHHGLRGAEADRDADWVRSHCNSLNIQCLVSTISKEQWAEKKGESTQMVARKLRYAIFTEAARELEADRLALGHDSDDLVETVLLNLIRGSGRSGLAGIPPKRPMDLDGRGSSKPVTLIRPLIETCRAEILGFLREENIPYLLDPSNDSDKYQRNRVRNHILPLLEQENPGIRNRIRETAEILRTEEKWLMDESARAMSSVRASSAQGEPAIDLTRFSSLSIALQRRVLHAILKGFDAAPPEFETISKIIGLTEQTALELCGEKRLSLPGGIVAIRDGARLIIQKANPEPSGTSQSLMNACMVCVPGVVELPSWGIRIESSLAPRDRSLSVACPSDEAILDADGTGTSLSVRSRRSGDRFRPLGIGGSKKVQDFLVDARIPRRFRDRVPLLITSGGEIAWIIGHRIDDRFKIRPETRQILRLKVSPLTPSIPCPEQSKRK